MNKKIYTAFISSAFESLRDERKTVIDILLDFRVMPFSMEHFTVSSNNEFKEIEALIDESDVFIILLGKCYGSCDENGVSWTEREYLYAKKKNKPIIAIVCDELALTMGKDETELSEDEKRQIAFRESIPFARCVDDKTSIDAIITKYLGNKEIIEKWQGWVRSDSSELYGDELTIWKEKNKRYNIAGVWYHVHLSEDDESYIRVGHIDIVQNFTPDHYTNLHIDGHNYNVDYYDLQNKKIAVDDMKHSRFEGEYTMKGSEIFGIFISERLFLGKFATQEVSKGSHRGIHDFHLVKSDGVTERIDGEFHDEAPSPKQGRIFMFREESERDAFLLRHREKMVKVR